MVLDLPQCKMPLFLTFLFVALKNGGKIARIFKMP